MRRPRARARRPGVPCLDFHIKRCLAPCVDYISKDDYRALIDRTIAFLSGQYRGLEQGLRREMRRPAAAHQFEQAAVVPRPTQRGAPPDAASVGDERGDRDPRRPRRASEDDASNVQVLQVRDGVMQDRQSFFLESPRRERTGRGHRGLRARSTTASGSPSRRSSSSRAVRTARRFGAARASGAAPASRCASRSAATSESSSRWPQRNAVYSPRSGASRVPSGRAHAAARR